MRVLVTGGAGFIGSYLVERLVEDGKDVTIYDNWTNPCLGIEEFRHGPIDIVRGDILDPFDLEVACEDVDMIYHLAVGHLLQSLEVPFTVHRINSEGTLNVCETCRKNDLKLVYVSSCEVLGNTTEYPSTETAPTNPTTVYGASKLVGEKYVQVYHSLYEIPAVIVRPFNCYGLRKGGRYIDVITKFIKDAINGNPLEIHGDGKQTRDFTHVSDVVEGIVLASKLENCESVNIASGRETSINELVQIVTDLELGEAWSVHVGDRPGQNRRMWGDITLAKKLLGFEPKVKLEEGVEELAHQIK